MRRILMISAVVMLIAGVSLVAQEKKSKPMDHSMKGYLVDKMCGSGMAKKSPEEAMKKASKHTKGCAMEESCMESGYGLISNGNFFKFDEAGDKQALELLKKSDKKKDFYVEVVGEHDGDMMNVTSLKEAKMESKKIEKKEEKD